MDANTTAQPHGIHWPALQNLILYDKTEKLIRTKLRIRSINRNMIQLILISFSNEAFSLSLHLSFNSCVFIAKRFNCWPYSCLLSMCSYSEFNFTFEATLSWVKHLHWNASKQNINFIVKSFWQMLFPMIISWNIFENFTWSYISPS